VSPFEQVALRLDGELLELVDKAVERRQSERPWDKVSRADILREALWKLLKPSAPGRVSKG
jgi:hypothetical protein